MNNDSRLDELESILGKSVSSKGGSRLDEKLSQFDERDVKKATGATKSEGTVVVSFRVPAEIERAAVQAAADLRVPYSEFKKAVFYRGLLAFTRDEEDVPLQYGRNIEAAPPSL